MNAARIAQENPAIRASERTSWHHDPTACCGDPSTGCKCAILGKSAERVERSKFFGIARDATITLPELPAPEIDTRRELAMLAKCFGLGIGIASVLAAIVIFFRAIGSSQ